MWIAASRPWHATFLLAWHGPSGSNMWLEAAMRAHASTAHPFPPKTRRLSAIYQPAFVWGGAGVATGGEKSGCLSLYCTATGRWACRGSLESEGWAAG